MTTPADYISNFSNDRLTIIAQALLDECYTTDEDLQSPYDTSYGRGTTRFDRQRSRLLQMPLEHKWLSTTNAGFDFFIISGEDADANREYDIKFIGFDKYHKISCVWSLSDHSTTGYVAPVNGNIAPSIPTPPARTTLPSEEKKAKKADDRE